MAGNVQVICKTHADAVAPHAAPLTTILVQVFPSVANDVCLCDSIHSVLEAMAKAPGALRPMASAGVPQLLTEMQAATEAGPKKAYLVEGCLDLLCSFVSSSDISVAPCPHGALSLPAWSQTRSLYGWPWSACIVWGWNPMSATGGFVQHFERTDMHALDATNAKQLAAHIAGRSPPAIPDPAPAYTSAAVCTHLQARRRRSMCA